MEKEKETLSDSQWPKIPVYTVNTNKGKSHHCVKLG